MLKVSSQKVLANSGEARQRGRAVFDEGIAARLLPRRKTLEIGSRSPYELPRLFEGLLLKVLLVLSFLLGPLVGFTHEDSQRNYHHSLTKDEREQISYLICTMGFKSLPKIWKERSSLKRAGDKIDHIHPLRFLSCIFTDEEMKAAMSNLKGRNFVWTEFKKGLFDTLTEESENDNMSRAIIEDFAKQVKIDSHLILRPMQHQKWEECINLLIKHVPRAGNPKRYDM